MRLSLNVACYIARAKFRYVHPRSCIDRNLYTRFSHTQHIRGGIFDIYSSNSSLLYECCTLSNPLARPTTIPVNKGSGRVTEGTVREFDKGCTGSVVRTRILGARGSQRQSATIMASWMVGRSLAANYRCVSTIMEIRLKPSICDALWWLFGILIGKSQLTRQYDRLDSRRRRLFTPAMYRSELRTPSLEKPTVLCNQMHIRKIWFEFIRHV